jgi:hypothetical protein
MSKRSNGYKSKPHTTPIPPPPPPPPKKESFYSKFKRNWDKYWPWLLVVSVLLGILANVDKIKPHFQSDQKNFENVTTLQGKIKGPEFSNDYFLTKEAPIIFKSNPMPSVHPLRGIYIGDIYKKGVIHVQAGSSLFDVTAQELALGLPILCPGIVDDKNPKCYIKAIARDNRLFFYCIFKDYLLDTEIGVMEYDHWKLYTDNIRGFEPGEYSLEVRDKHGNIVFSIQYYEALNLIKINGYFLTDKAIYVFNSYKDFKELLPGTDLVPDAAKQTQIILRADSSFKQKAEAATFQVQSLSEKSPM